MGTTIALRRTGQDGAEMRDMSVPCSRHVPRVLAVAALALAPSLAQSAEQARPFYAGKQISIVVGLPPGGGADVYARLVQRYLSRHIGGAPTILVQNMPGAGSLKSVMYLNPHAPADGTVMVTFSSALLNEALTAPERVRADFRAYRWIGNVSEDVRVCYVWGASGVRNWQDMIGRQKALFMGATASGTAGNADTGMLQHLFGVKINQVQGYAGSADKRLAVERREIDGDCGGWTSGSEDWLRGKKINIVVRLSPPLVPGLDPSVPFGRVLVKDGRHRKIYDFLIAPERLGRLFMVSDKVPPNPVAAFPPGSHAMSPHPGFR